MRLIACMANFFTGTVCAYGETLSGKTYAMRSINDFPRFIPLNFLAEVKVKDSHTAIKSKVTKIELRR